MLIDWQDQYSENVHSISSNLDIQFNLHQNSNVIFQKNINNLKFHMEAQKMQDPVSVRNGQTLTVCNFE